MCARFVRDDSGQDIIEYALLSSILAIAGILLLPLIYTRIQDLWEPTHTDVNDLWIPNDPS